MKLFETKNYLFTQIPNSGFTVKTLIYSGVYIPSKNHSPLLKIIIEWGGGEINKFLGKQSYKDDYLKKNLSRINFV